MPKTNTKIIPYNRDVSSRFRADMAKEKNMIGKKISEARKKMGITQAELPGLLSYFGVHVKAPAVNKWEKGETVPNAYQLLALCHALDIPEGLDYFTGPILPKKEVLNATGLRMLGNYRDFLESNPRYTINYKVIEIEMPVSLLPASAGTGDYLDDECFERKMFPASSVPEGADFAVPVDGDSMEPLYKDGQLAWIQATSSLNVGDVGLFTVDGHGFIKTYDEKEPDEEHLEEYLDSNGVLHPQVILISQNKAYEPKIITPNMRFQIIGRVLN